ncbi:MAG: IS91 family transposase [archaeon]|nr:IS91 family transposase [archaeon]
MVQPFDKSVDLADVLREGLSAFITKYKNLPGKHWKVVNNILNCRTSVLGGHVYKCDNCEYTSIAYNSCRDRHCPKCQSVARAVWVKKRVDELLPVGYYHVVFTIPDSFNPFALRNKKVMYDLLFKAVSETLLELGLDPKWLGAKIGFICILHSWGQNLMDHPHIHCIIPGGGIKKDKKEWKYFSDKYLMPDKVMAKLFKGKFLDYFKNAVTNKQIHLLGSLRKYKNSSNFNSFKDEQYQKEWVVFSKAPFGSAEKVIKYLGKYTNRIAISNQRIISLEDGMVSFWCKDYKDNNKQKIIKLDIVEFIRRFLLHILPNGYVRIRYFGILSNSNKNEKLTNCFNLLGERWEKQSSPQNASSCLLFIMNIDITLCPNCKTGHMFLYKEILKEPVTQLCLAA